MGYQANGEIVIGSVLRRAPDGQHVRFYRVRIGGGRLAWTCDCRRAIFGPTKRSVLEDTPRGRWEVAYGVRRDAPCVFAAEFDEPNN